MKPSSANRILCILLDTETNNHCRYSFYHMYVMDVLLIYTSSGKFQVLLPVLKLCIRNIVQLAVIFLIPSFLCEITALVLFMILKDLSCLLPYYVSSPRLLLEYDAADNSLKCQIHTPAPQ